MNKAITIRPRELELLLTERKTLRFRHIFIGFFLGVLYTTGVYLIWQTL